MTQQIKVTVAVWFPTDRTIKELSWLAEPADIDLAYETWGERGDWQWRVQDRTGLGIEQAFVSLRKV